MYLSVDKGESEHYVGSFGVFLQQLLYAFKFLFLEEGLCGQFNISGCELPICENYCLGQGGGRVFQM
jgi:hypothetical protein